MVKDEETKVFNKFLLFLATKYFPVLSIYIQINISVKTEQYSVIKQPGKNAKQTHSNNWEIERYK